jgi:3-hydroxyacyl-[acyl-carrier-protein] dehydratase
MKDWPMPSESALAHLDRTHIEGLIPHRSPMLLLDLVTILNDLEATGSYFVTGDEFFLQGHFPGNPIVPGNIVNEMMAQLGAVLLCYQSSFTDSPFHKLRAGKAPILAGLDQVQYKSPAKPGERLTLQIEITKDAGLVATGKATAAVGDRLIASLLITVAFL